MCFSSNVKNNFFFLLFNWIFSDVTERPDLTGPLFLDHVTSDDLNGTDGDYCCPASPTTVPVKTSRSNSSDTPNRPPRVQRQRQRTTSMNQTTASNPSDSIIRANNRTIYTAGRPPWYNCAGQQVEPFVIGKQKQIFFFLLKSYCFKKLYYYFYLFHVTTRLSNFLII